MEYVRDSKKHLMQVKARLMYMETDYHNENFKKMKKDLRGGQKIETGSGASQFCSTQNDYSYSPGLLETIVSEISTPYLKVFH